MSSYTNQARRRHVVAVLLTPDEKAAVARAAAKDGVSQSTWVRTLVAQMLRQRHKILGETLVGEAHTPAP